MQPHEFRRREPDKPGPGSRQTKWLLLAIAVLLGLVVTRVLWRFL
jgi:hypothetical protein